MGAATLDDKVFNRAKKIHGCKFDYSNSTIESKPCGKSTKRYIMNIFCNDCGCIFDATINNHIDKKSSCRACFGKQEWTLKLFIQEAENLYPGIFNLKDCYLTKSEKERKTVVNEILCNKCEYVFNQIPKDFFKSTCGCPSCAGRAAYTTRLVVLRGRKVYKDRFNYDEISLIYREWKDGRILTFIEDVFCTKCRSYFLTRADNHLGINKSGCPKCKASKGEISIANSLLSLGVDYETQKRFNTCRLKRALPFDFFLPCFNLLIEYQGKLHHFAVDHFGGQEALEYTKKRDKIKADWADQSPYELLYINYWQYDHIVEILADRLQSK